MRYDAFKLVEAINEIAPNSHTLIVGGAVRDHILVEECNDIDIATNADLALIEKHFPTHDIGKSKDFGVVVVLFEGASYEVANFRTDGEYSDGRHPNAVKIASTFEEDTKRRDFTINALGLDVNGNVFDYHNGVADIKNGILRAVGNPLERYEEDALRIIRLFRFSAKLGFEIESKTLDDAIVAIEEGFLSRISPERIRGEFFKIAKRGEDLADFIEILEFTGALEVILPEVQALRGKKQSVEHHPEGDAYEHTIACLRVSRSDNPVTNLSILFHDLGKAVTYVFDDGRHTYFGHEKAGIPIVEEIVKRLKFSNAEKDAFVFVTGKHMIGHKIHELSKKNVVHLVNDVNWEVLKDAIYADEVCRGITTRGVEQFNEKINNAEKIVYKLNGETNLKNRLKEFIDGNLILTLRPELVGNPIIGRIKNSIEGFIIDNDFNVNKEKINKLILDF